jgi:hypothetical protein
MPYSQDVLTRITNVHWVEEGSPSPSLSLGWRADMIDESGGGAPPLWAPHTATVMSVSVEGLPPLGRTTLVVDPQIPAIPGDWDFSTFQDEVNGSFPDGDSGTITADYFAKQPFGQPTVQGSVNYFTDVVMNENPFNGASVVSITIAVQLRPIEVRDHGYEWFAIAGAGGVSVPGIRIGGTAGSGDTLTFTATLNLKAEPPTLVLS